MAGSESVSRIKEKQEESRREMNDEVDEMVAQDLSSAAEIIQGEARIGQQGWQILGCLAHRSARKMIAIQITGVAGCRRTHRFSTMVWKSSKCQSP